MSRLQDLLPEIRYNVLELLHFKELINVYPSLPYTWKITADHLTIALFLKYIKDGETHVSCALGDTGYHGRKLKLPQSTRFKYEDMKWSPPLLKSPTPRLGVDGKSFSITMKLSADDQEILPAVARDFSRYSNGRYFIGAENSKDGPYEIKRIVIQFDPPKGTPLDEGSIC